MSEGHIRGALGDEAADPDQAHRAGLEVDVVGLSQVSQLTYRLGDAVVVSTLPANALAGRMFPEESRLDGHLLLDVVYAGWPTPLLRTFEEAEGGVGVRDDASSGSGPVQLLTGLRAPIERMRAAVRAAIESR